MRVTCKHNQKRYLVANRLLRTSAAKRTSVDASPLLTYAGCRRTR
jgi:hypothetical protein